MQGDPTQAFDAAIIISLKRRQDRLESLTGELSNWPFKCRVLVQNAVDGAIVKPPKSFLPGIGAARVWGCFQSHRQALERSLMEGFRSVLILEDDATLSSDFNTRSLQFLKDVPDDWEILYLGGQHYPHMPIAHSPGIVTPQTIERMHGYAVRGDAIMDMYTYLHEPHANHVDKVLMHWVTKRKTYCPQPFLIGQKKGQSEILFDIPKKQYANLVTQFWNVPDDRVLAEKPPQISYKYEPVDPDATPIMSLCMPTRGRCDLAIHALNTFYDTTRGYNVEAVVACHPDESLPVLQSLMLNTDRYPNLQVIEAGEDMDAIQAWNLAYTRTRGTLIKIGDDDCEYTPGWLDAVLRKHDEAGRPHRVLYGLYDPDMRVRLGELFTRSVLSRGFVDDIMNGKLCCPLVRRWYNDNITFQLAKKHGCAIECFDSIVNHNQASCGKMEWDATAEIGKQRGVNDQSIYEKWVADGMKVTW